ncbi:O-antigen ligase-like membrane protein [Cellulophaga sp. RHA_52]|uniref:O-antigen ligase family protein n=1 Tax=Cellulophaga sp. RHA_52 TaxID=1250036 RepID=UPI00119A809D|nr:O-antigen ligase family protein [Cellulophaga sp. RHA_52]TVZ08243.1 O-antigen ligase-like membrane protein [Cellulophaga sp. RHA_52]
MRLISSISNQSFLQISLSLFSFSLTFSPNWNSKALILLVISVIFNIRKVNFSIKRNSIINVIILTVIYLTLNMLFLLSKIQFEGYEIIGIFALFYLLFNLVNFSKVKIKPILYSFVIGVLLVGVINLMYFLVQADFLKSFKLFNQWNNFLFIDIHKIYFSININVAYAIVLFYYFKKEIAFLKLFVFILLTVLLLFFTGAMSGIVIFFLLSVLALFKLFFIHYLKAITTFFMLGPLLIMFLLSFSEVQDVFQTLDGERSRIRNYNVNVNLFKESPIFGYGVGNEENTMQSVRNIKSWEFINNYNAHNQYFEFLIGGGILYLTLFVSILFLAYYRLITIDGPFSFFFTNLLILFLYVFLIESLLVRHHGIMLFSFFINLIFIFSINEKQKAKNEI